MNGHYGQKCQDCGSCEILNTGVDSVENQLEQEHSYEIVGELRHSNPKQGTGLMLDNLAYAIRQSTTTNVEIPIHRSVYQTMKDEIDLFRKTGTKSKHLNLLLNALDSIPPTSVESEKVFSATGLFITKIRSRLGDGIMDTLCFLKKLFHEVRLDQT
ncbi:hypothetical protein LOD99_8274 [Oopsacas minuta]|uniref:HAT C-terminal dimerisation domain-containing protein n=1 Tax=Oopsacas minuta TaxID=111878 RepID=A0AAV7JHV9_9METZ|nr:hypothetical protein LOD99_8274 [Oopsacas minuta]